MTGISFSRFMSPLTFHHREQARGNRSCLCELPQFLQFGLVHFAGSGAWCCGASWSPDRTDNRRLSRRSTWKIKREEIVKDCSKVMRWRIGHQISQIHTPLVEPSSSGGGCSALAASSSASHFFCPWLGPGLLRLSAPPRWLAWLLSPPSAGSSHATGLSLALWRTNIISGTTFDQSHTWVYTSYTALAISHTHWVTVHVTPSV